MIEIIKHGKKKYHFVCDKCGCEFTTDGAEIFSEKRPGGKRWIYCPECGHEIIVSEYDPKVEEELVKNLQEVDINTVGTGGSKKDLVKKDNKYVNDWLEESKKLYYDCSKCPNKPDFSKGPIVGDTPCTWCPKHTPTCVTTSWVSGIDTSTQDSDTKYELKSADDYKYGPNLNTVKFTTPEEIDYYIDTPSTYTVFTSDCYKGK